MVGCDVCGSAHNLLRCAQCQNCYCQSHQLPHLQTHEQLELRTSGQVVATDPNESAWGQGESSSSALSPLDIVRSAAAAHDFPHHRPNTVSGHSPQSQQFLEQASADHRHLQEPSQGQFDHGWATNVGQDSGISRYENEWVAASAHAVDSGQFVSQVDPRLPQPYLEHRNIRLTAPVSPEMPSTDAEDDWMKIMCDYVIQDMDKYGICVIDNFAGQAMGEAVLEEVVAMYAEGHFMDGEVMGTPGPNSSKTIRGDKIVWVDGIEPGCKNIGSLIHLVDAVVLTSNRMRDNGKLGEYSISERSRAMVACYPGGGTQYVKHVDNPNKDGRCITCIYYLNKDWDVKQDGGMLRIFPQGWSMSVADIDPIFDRILLFWSDRRNPHEVQPALRTRYAITLWYYDKAEADASHRHSQEEAQQMHASIGANAVQNF